MEILTFLMQNKTFIIRLKEKNRKKKLNSYYFETFASVIKLTILKIPSCCII